MVRPFVFRRYLDFGSLDEIRAMKERIQREVTWKKAYPVDVKMGRGGIREVEFMVQTLQIIFGGKFPKARVKGTLTSLDILHSLEFLEGAVREDLKNAYHFLRGVEHRVQMVHHRQTHRLPTNDRELNRIAGLMGYLGEDKDVQRFLDDLDNHMEKVHAAFEGLLESPQDRKEEGADSRVERILADLEDEQRSLALLEEAGFREPKSIRSTIRRVLGEKFPARRSPKAWQSLHRLFPSILQGVLETTAPDQALFRLESFMESIGPRGGYYALLEENPKTLERLISLFGGSALLSRWLTMHLEAVDALIDRGHYRPSREKGELLEEVESLLDGLNDSEERLGRLRAVRAQEILRIGAAELWGALGPAEVGKELTNLGEIFLEMTFREVLRTMGYSSDEPYPPLCILGLGTFGGEALSYRSDLDLLLVYEDDERWGQKGGSSSEHLAKLGQKLLSWMSMPMREGPGWEVDVRLRPSGNTGGRFSRRRRPLSGITGTKERPGSARCS